MARKSVILSGQLGAGKSTIENWLVSAEGYRQPKVIATRLAASYEHHVLSVTDEEFVENARSGLIVLPIKFGGNWYGYDREAWEEAISTSGNWVFNLRPYSGLIVRTLVPNAVDIWIEAQNNLRIERIRARDEMKDKNLIRSILDEQDFFYRALYNNHIANDDPDLAKSEIIKLL